MSLINDALKKAEQKQRQMKSQRLDSVLEPVERIRSSRASSTKWYLSGLLLLAIAGTILYKYSQNQNIDRTNLAEAKTTKMENQTVIKPPQPHQTVNNQQSLAVKPESKSEKEIESEKTLPVEIARTATVVVAQTEKGFVPVAIVNKDTNTTTIETKSAVIVNEQTRIDKPQSVSSSQAINVGEPTPKIVSTAPQTNMVVSPAREFPALRLTGIFYQTTRPSAIINGRPVFIGDEIEGVKIISIERNSVSVKFGEEVKVLRF